MSSITLQPENQQQLAQRMQDDVWVVACLCAAWCDTCRAYRPTFDTLADKYPAHCFVWIDIEDQADLVGDWDIENFPTLLIQHKDQVMFYGTVLPDLRVADRLLCAQIERTTETSSVDSCTQQSPQVSNLRIRLTSQP